RLFHSGPRDEELLRLELASPPRSGPRAAGAGCRVPPRRATPRVARRGGVSLARPQRALERGPGVQRAPRLPDRHPVHQQPPPRQRTLEPPPGPRGGVALGDVDGDGLPDGYLTSTDGSTGLH